MNLHSTTGSTTSAATGTGRQLRRVGLLAGPALLVGGLVVLAAPGPGQAQDTGGTRPVAPPVSRAAATAPCVGGATVKSFTGGYDDWLSVSSGSQQVPGTLFRFKGPTKGKDVVSVTVTSPLTYISSGDYGNVRVLLDGTPMAPSDLSGDWLYPDSNYGSYASQFCATVGKGGHSIRLVMKSVDSNSSGYDYTQLFHPMLHAEVNK